MYFVYHSLSVINFGGIGHLGFSLFFYESTALYSIRLGSLVAEIWGSEDARVSAHFPFVHYYNFEGLDCADGTRGS